MLGRLAEEERLLNPSANLDLPLARLRQFFQGGQERCLQIQNAPACAQTHLQLVGVKGLGQIVIRARLHPFDHIFLPPLPRQQDQIDVRGSRPPPDFAADLHAVQARHQPVEDSQLRGVFSLQYLPRFGPIAGNHDVVAFVDQ